MKYCCRNCGSFFEPGDKTENVEMHSQSWPCPMCGICDWEPISKEFDFSKAAMSESFALVSQRMDKMVTHSCRFSSVSKNISNKPKKVKDYNTLILKQYFDKLHPILNLGGEEVTVEQKELMKEVLVVAIGAYEDGEERGGAWDATLDRLPSVGGFH
jgi:hypothetical protein